MIKLSRFYLLLAITSILCLSSCKDDEATTLSTDVTNINISSDGGSSNFIITTNASSWQITNSAPEWVSLSATSGSSSKATINVTVITKTLTQRSATLTIQAGSAAPVEITIQQAASNYLYSLTTNVGTLEMLKTANTSSFYITSNAPTWNVATDVDWLSFDQTSGSGSPTKITVSAALNTTDNNRSGKIIVSAQYAPSDTIEVVQSGAYNLSADVSSLTFKIGGSTSTFTITTTSPQWNISSDGNWLTFNKTSGTVSPSTIQVTAAPNKTDSPRTCKITIEGQNAPSYIIDVTQSGPLYPSYNTSPIASDQTGVNSTSFQLLSKIKIGWNLGNSMEVPNDETDWGNPKTTQAIIDKVKALGFNAVRIPCAWDCYANQTTAKISDTWLARVKQVVDYCVNNDMYVILNIHWDGGWLEEHPLYSYQEAVNMKQQAFWEQIATYFRDYDEHLLFAGTNEVHENYNTPSEENLIVQMSFNQTFVDAVRSTGGKNAYRNLVVQSYNTNIDYAYNSLVMPTDAASTRLILETHYYDPWDFAGTKSDESGTIYYWGKEGGYTTGISNWGQEDYVRTQFNKLKTKFVDNGYPVIMGEYGAVNRSLATALDTQTKKNNHIESRAYYLEYVTQKMKENGIVPIYWDNGYTGKDGFALFDRNTLTTSDQKALTAIITGATNGVYPF
jgi:endoglucanase